MPRYEDRVNALASYLEVDPSTIKDSYRENLFETEDGEEYFVVTEDEGRELAREDIEGIVDDLGISAFSPDFQDWIIMNAVDSDWFEDACRESYENYAYDIQSEKDDEYGTRLAAECVENGLVSEEDFEDGEYIGSEDLAELLSEYLFDQVDDYVEWYRDDFGDSDLTYVVTNYNLLDMDAIVDECLTWDGVAHFVASYDGDEIELDNDLYAYRVN